MNVKHSNIMTEDEEWNPGYYNDKGIFITYEKSWYCNENKTIHQNVKEKDNCKYCNPQKL